MASTRSDLIDVTYQQLHALASGEAQEATSPEQLKRHLEARRNVLGKVTNVFGKPSDASKKKLEGATVSLPDGVDMNISELEREFSLAISNKFQVDQVQAFILLRSFFYNRGLQTSADGSSEAELLNELLHLMVDFVHSERLHTFRTLFPLFRADGNDDDPYHTVASQFLATIIPDGQAFAQSLLDEYRAKILQPLPAELQTHSTEAVAWAKRNLQHQLALLELLFWTMWAYVRCSGPLVENIFKTAYETNLGSEQTNNTLLLDQESAQLREDCAALWILIMTEVLNLESVALPDAIDFSISSSSSATEPYYTDPESLKRIHDMVISHTDSQFSAAFLAWAYVLERLSSLATKQTDLAPSWDSFLRYINPPVPRSYSNDREPIHTQMAHMCLQPSAGLLDLLQNLLTNSPLFVMSISLKRHSSVTDSNSVAYRSVLKGLIIALVEFVPVEQVPDFDALVEVWISLFGRSEEASVSGICRQFWDGDWHAGIARRAIIEVARSRFPIHVRPLIRLLRVMTGKGFLNTDPLQIPSQQTELTPERQSCDEFVYYYMLNLDSYSTVVPVSACTGPHALYERQSERGNQAGNLFYTNLRPLRLPGGVEVPTRSKARLLSADNPSQVVLRWEVRHSGWKLILELLTSYVNQRRMQFTTTSAHEVPHVAGRRHDMHPVTLKIADIGMELDSEGDEVVITDALDLIRCLIENNPYKAEELVASLQRPPQILSHSTPDSTSPGLPQLTTMILEDALSQMSGRGGSRSVSQARLVTSAIDVLTSMLAVQSCSPHVWLFIRSTPTLFGGDRSQGQGFASAALASERATGTYTMTLSLLALVQALFKEAMQSIRKPPGLEKLPVVKEEVMLRALRFVHTEIWVEHASWKYVQLGERFEIGRRVLELYTFVFEHAPPSLPLSPATLSSATSPPKPFPLLSQTVADVWLFKATTSTINPLITPISTGQHLFAVLSRARRNIDSNQLLGLLRASLKLCYNVLTFKLRSSSSSSDGPSEIAGKPSLLDQALCARVAGGGNIHDAAMRGSTLGAAGGTRGGGGGTTRADPIDVLASLTCDRSLGPDIPLEAIKVLTALGSCLAAIQEAQSGVSPSGGPGGGVSGPAGLLGPGAAGMGGGGGGGFAASMAISAPTIIGHLENPEKVVEKMVRIVQHPYDEMVLRKAIWSFMTFAVDKEPALGALFVSGKSHGPGDFRKGGGAKGKAKAIEDKKEEGKKVEKDKADKDSMFLTASSGLEAATEILKSWAELWDANPLLLASVTQFLHAVWQHALQHKASLESLREDGEFWECLVGLATKEVGPVPEYVGQEFAVIDGVLRTNFNETVQSHSYRVAAKAHALRVLTRDIGLHLQLHGSEVPLKNPTSFLKLEGFFREPDSVSDLLQEAAPSSFKPELHDEMTKQLETHFPELTLQQLEIQAPLSDREYGDLFVFSAQLLRTRIQAYDPNADLMEAPVMVVAQQTLFSLNLNLSLVHAETFLMEAWEALLKQVIPYLRTDKALRPILLNVANDIGFNIARENRRGDMMSSIHNVRLSLLLSVLELAWFSSQGEKAEINSFVGLVRQVRSITLNESQSPSRSLISPGTAPFHRALLQVIFFCLKQSRSLLDRPKALTAEHRLAIGQMVESTLVFVVDGLRVVFTSARDRADIDLDRDMRLLVGVFRQCTRKEMGVPSTSWLARLQETDVIRTSLELFVHIDLVGLSDLPLLLSRKQPLYAPHILHFHTTLASNPSSAERLANEGILAAYSNNFISSAISSGLIDVVLPELPTRQSPAHAAYCAMVSIVAGVIGALGRQNHYFDDEACGFVQLYGSQLSRALSWTIDDPITLPLLDELDQVVNLFYAIASSVPAAASHKANPVVEKVLSGFSGHALRLLQQINHAISHPNHLASLYEPVTQEERTRLEKAKPEADPLRRPFVTHLLYRFYRLSSLILGTLITISRAETVLLLGVEDWPMGEVWIAPYSKVVLTQPASLGTLVELGNQTFDILKNLVQRPPGQSIAEDTQGGPYSKVLGAKEGVVIARRNLEEILLYAVTQLAMWLAKPDSSDPGSSMDNMGMDMDEGAGPGGGASSAVGSSMDTSLVPTTGATAKDKRQMRSTGITMAERLRRGMTGEMVSDLQALLNKSKPIFASSDAVIGKAGVDLTHVLLTFLHERIGNVS